ncbi:recombinase family protein [Jeotgalibaca sp. MA1X17-3]|uniref:recombinase family protein n=1 Tax=Jeotgalibaca sp. MA1X17-3 TaxID=2908211 RepID=UPI001F20AB81|nr:recombinase family protein [Jeotgalibaca sp. MA1X17-3]UJF15100.1 recombinase family protein [Jeotgalibaca sp. MA1X17-3]
MKKRAGLYIRVSTTEQANEGYSIAAQTGKLKAYAEAKDYIVAKVYTDPAYSGAKLERPGLQEMIADIKNGSLDVVVVYKLDRLSRSQKHTLYLIQDVLKPNNVDFISLQESFDTSTSFGMAMVGILSVFAELERSTITERMMLGRTERAKEGYYHGGGNYQPLGYDYIDGELMVDEWEAEIVKEIFQLYLEGNSINSTAKLMQEKYPDRIKSKTLVRDTLKKQLYIGMVTFDGKQYKGIHEPILDVLTFEKAQKIMKKRSVGSSSTNKRKGLLVGKIYCSQCGERYGREVTGVKKYRYNWYTCYARLRGGKKRCSSRRWKEKELNDLVISRIQNIDFDEEVKNKKEKRPLLITRKNLKK